MHQQQGLFDLQKIIIHKKTNDTMKKTNLSMLFDSLPSQKIRSFWLILTLLICYSSSGWGQQYTVRTDLNGGIGTESSCGNGIRDCEPAQERYYQSGNIDFRVVDINSTYVTIALSKCDGSSFNNSSNSCYDISFRNDDGFCDNTNGNGTNLLEYSTSSSSQYDNTDFSNGSSSSRQFQIPTSALNLGSTPKKFRMFLEWLTNRTGSSGNGCAPRYTSGTWTPTNGRQLFYTGWIEISVNSSTGGGSLNCSGAVNLSCGVPYNGNTSGGNSNVSTYNCSTSWNESGPERVHKIDVSSAGTLTATLSNLGGVDLDVFILNSCSQNSCMNGADNVASTQVSPGTYYVVVDGFGGVSGGYTLKVDCPTTSTPVLFPPTNLNATAGGTSFINLTWNSVSGATRYYIYRDGTEIGFTQGNNSTSISDGGLQANTTYCYQVTACNSSNQCSDKSEQDCATTDSNPVLQPSMPTNLNATANGSTTINVGWGAATGATSYNLLINGSWIDVGNTTTYTHQVSAGSNHCYEIRACSDGSNGYAGCSGWSGQVCAATPLPTPTGLAAAATSPTSINVTWQAVTGAIRYEVLLNGGWVNAGNSLSYSNTGLTPLTSYCYKVRACNNNLCSAESDIPVCTTTPLPLPVITVVPVSSSANTITWQPVAGAGFYQIFSSNGSLIDFIPLASGTSYTHTGLIGGTEYCYFVQATHNFNSSLSSNSTPACATTYPAAPNITVAATPTSSSAITISWGAVGTATSYNVYQVGNPAPIASNVTGLSYNHTGLNASLSYCYYVRACNSAGQCSGNSIERCARPIPNAPVITASATSTSTISIAWPAGSVGATSYTVYQVGNPTPIASNITALNYTATGLNAGTNYCYTVRACNLSGCSGNSAQACATTLCPSAAAPTITASGVTTFCAGSNVTLTASGTGTALWSNGATGNTITVTNSGAYTVRRISGNCTSSVSAALSVTVNPIPATPSITASGTTTFCGSGSVTLTASGSGGTVLWSTGATSNAITVTAAGAYTVRRVANGCTSAVSAATNVIINAIPTTPTISVSGTTTFCAGGSRTLTASGSGGTVLWSNGATTSTITVNASGSYTVRRIASGCTSAVSVATVITVTPLPATPTIAASGSTTFCGSGSVTLTASGSGGTVLWSTGATSNAITVNGAGAYTCRRIANGCTSAVSAATNIIINPIPVMPIITPSGSTALCTGGSVVLTASGSGGTVLWSNGTTANTLTVTAAGSYTCSRIANGCTSAVSPAVAVTVNPLPATPTIAVAGNNTCAVSLSATGGATYIWVLGTTVQSGTAATFTPSVSGSYRVRCVSASGCTSALSPAVAVTVVNALTAPSISAAGATTFCVGGSVVLNATGAPAGSVYKWSNGATGANLTVTTSGSYTASYTRAGCNSVASSAITVTATPIPATPTITASAATSFCAGGSVVLTPSGSGGTVLWSNGATTNTISVNASGSYTVRRIANGCTSAVSAATVITVNPIPATPTIAVTGGATTFCEGGSRTLTASAGTGTVLWSNGATTNAISVDESGSYTCRRIANGCTSAVSAATVITVNPIPATPTITASGATTFCTGGNVTLTASGSGGTVLWSNGATTNTISVNASGSYTVRRIASGCTSAVSEATVITVNPIPATPTIAVTGGATTFCEGGSRTLTASAGTGTVLWSNGATTNAISVDESGSYTCRRIANGCTSAVSAATVIMVNPIPATPAITASGATTFCVGSNVTLTASGTGGTVLWSTGATTNTISITASGSYTVRRIASGCTSAVSAATVITVNPIPATPTISNSGTNTFCAGDSRVLTASTGTGTVLWSNGATTNTITVTVAGSYTCRRIANGCTSAVSAATIITVNPVPATPTISNSGTNTFCAGDSRVLTASTGTGTILWSTGATTNTISVNTSGSYTCRRIANGCTSAVSAATVITVNPIPATPTISNSGTNTFCAGDSRVLTASTGAGTVLWSNGATTNTITVTVAGSYTCRRIANGCTSAVSAATVITVNPIPATPTISNSGTNTFCAGDSRVLTASTGTGTILWSTGATTNTISVNTSGSYTCRRIANGCTSAVSPATTITVNPSPVTPVITPSGSTALCTGGSVVLTASGSGGSVLWSNGTTANTLTVTAAGSYTCSRIANGCTSAVSPAVAVTVNPLPATPTIAVAGNNTCAVSLSATGGATYIWVLGTTVQSGTAATFTPSVSGSYRVRCVSAAGCTSALSPAVAVTVVNALAAPSISAAGATTFCAGGSVVLNATGAPAGSVYKWSNGVTGANLTVTTSGSYTASYVSAGCNSASSSAITVTATPLPATPTITASAATSFCAGGSVVLTPSGSGGTVLWSNGATTNTISVNASGSYTVRRIANGCTSAVSAATVITVNPIPATPTISNSGTNAICAGSSRVLTTSAGTGTALWSTGATTNTITVTEAGSYTVRRIANGCTSAVSAATVITVNPIPATPTIALSGASSFCSGGSAVVNVQNPLANTTYVWSNGTVGNSTTVTNAGDFSVRAVAGSCTSAVSNVVTITPVLATPVISLTAGNTSLCTAGSNATLSVSNPVANATYLWSNGTSGNSITVTAAGNYGVKVIAAGCTSETSNTIAILVGQPSASTANKAICIGSSYVFGNQTLTTAGIYTATFTSAAGCDSVVTLNLSIRPTAAGNSSATVCKQSLPYIFNGKPLTASGIYLDTLTSTNGCDSLLTFRLSVHSVSIINTANTLKAKALQGSSFKWLLDNTPIAGATDSVYLATQSGKYSAIATLNSCVDTNSLVVDVENIAQPVISGKTTVCGGDTIRLSTDFAANVSYSWTGPNGFTANGQTISIANANASNAGQYSLQIISNGKTSPTQTANVSVTAFTPIFPANVTITRGESIALNASGGNVYTWTPAKGLSATNIANPVASPDSTITYLLTISDAQGCSQTRTITVSVTEGGLPNDVYVPNAFTPNQDGENDVLKVYGNNLYEYELLIFNRLGNEVGIVDETLIYPSWSGMYKGKLLAGETLVWTLKGRYNDGTTFSKKGSVVVLK